MTRPFSLSPEQLEQFERLGVVRLEGLFSADGVRSAREAVLRRLAQRGITEAGGWRLDDPRLNEVRAGHPWWRVSQPLPSRAIGGQPGRASELEALGREPALLAAAEALLGGREFDRTGQQRLRVLINLPDPAPWTTPRGWHTDSQQLASGQSPGLQLFAFLDVVGPGGGGTLVVTGSHRLLKSGRFMTQPQVRERLNQHPFFKRFESEAPTEPKDQARLMSETYLAGDVELKIMELTGQPGDAYFTDLRLAHTGRPNSSDHPRLMITRPFIRADLKREIREGPGRR
ncbi:MAG TPA: phytanoyl-CoA dioxygenase family protein [Caulobacteraceae bacterium]|nr:phytanoyl-CoA dioxygenase family protein [Caulobacteraceae bacterium]